MLLIPQLEVRSSPIHGFGLFATAPIEKGTAVTGWRAERDFKLTQEQWSALPFNLRGFLYTYCWLGRDGCWYGTHDGARFTNHSTKPNIRWEEKRKSSVAIRDIAAGEEIFGRLLRLRRRFFRVRARARSRQTGARSDEAS